MAQKRFEGDFVINTIKNASGEQTSGGAVASIANIAPISLSIFGPPTIRRLAGETGNIPYVASNGGDPLNIPTATE